MTNPILSDRRRPSFVVEKLIGQGTFGKVFLVRDESTGGLYAVKRTPKWRCKASREALCLQINDGTAGVMGASSIFYSSTPRGFKVQNIVMDFMGSNLQQFLCKQRQKRDTTGNMHLEYAPWMKAICRQVVQGLHGLHMHGFMHRDLKPENVLVTLYLFLILRVVSSHIIPGRHLK